jgi:SAM-dependent methyltransferase
VEEKIHQRVDLLAGLYGPDSEPGLRFSTLLRFYHEVLGCKYQHYGLWEGDPLTLQGLKTAQERYSDNLCSWIPEGVKRILDVGCGTGGNAAKLSGMGFEVEGLSPDPYQQGVFTKGTKLPFHLTTCQAFRPERAYDLVLMSESAQYITLEELFPAVARCAPGGYLLACDYFVLKKDGSRMTRSGHLLDGFLQEADKHGFVVERSEDITDKVTPTLDLARIWLNSYVNPSLRILLESFHSKRPRLARSVFRLLRKRHDRFADWQHRLDSREFARVKRYKTFLVRVR